VHQKSWGICWLCRLSSSASKGAAHVVLKHLQYGHLECIVMCNLWRMKCCYPNSIGGIKDRGAVGGNINNRIAGHTKDGSDRVCGVIVGRRGCISCRDCYSCNTFSWAHLVLKYFSCLSLITVAVQYKQQQTFIYTYMSCSFSSSSL